VTGTPPIHLCNFPQSLQANTGVVRELVRDHFSTNTFRFMNSPPIRCCVVPITDSVLK
jgi:hypothetical protein